MVEGPDGLPADAIFEYRTLKPGRSADAKWQTCSAIMDDAIAIEVKPPIKSGRWLIQGRLLSGGKLLAMIEEPLYDVDLTTNSPQPFGLLGENKSLRETYGARIVPVDKTPTTVVSQVRKAGPRAISRLLKRVASGKKAIFLNLDPADVKMLNRVPGFPWKLDLTKTMCTFQGVFHYFRKGRFSKNLPGINPHEPTKYLAGEIYADIIPIWSLPELAGAKIHAGSAGTAKLGFEDPDGYMKSWNADVMEIEHGRGRIIFCQYQLFALTQFPYQKNQDGLSSCLLERLLKI